MNLDRIEVNDLRLVASVGVCPEEHQRRQPIAIDVVIETDMTHSGQSDRIDGTINYGDVIADVERIVMQDHHELLERVATLIAEHVLTDRRAQAVEVEVRKLRPPVPQDVASTAVRIRRTQPTPSTPASAMTTRAYLALGSNLGDRLGYLRLALRELGDLVVARSRVYETDPVGGPTDQGAYLNMVVAVDTVLDPYALLRRCRDAEVAAGRVRSERDGPRTLDVDVLLYTGTTTTSEQLTVPHPRMYQRRFVLQPLADVAPALVPPGWETHVGPGAVYVTDLVP